MRIPNNAGIKNLSAFDLNRYIDKRLSAARTGDLRSGSVNVADLATLGEPDEVKKKDLWKNVQRRKMITNQFNFTDIPDPFADHSLTL